MIYYYLSLNKIDEAKNLITIKKVWLKKFSDGDLAQAKYVYACMFM